jgi:hypothetical protein
MLYRSRASSEFLNPMKYLHALFLVPAGAVIALSSDRVYLIFAVINDVSISTIVEPLVDKHTRVNAGKEAGQAFA